MDSQNVFHNIKVSDTSKTIKDFLEENKVVLKGFDLVDSQTKGSQKYPFTSLQYIIQASNNVGDVLKQFSLVAMSLSELNKIYDLSTVKLSMYWSSGHCIVNKHVLEDLSDWIGEMGNLQ